jgi:hypothetical protein
MLQLQLKYASNKKAAAPYAAALLLVELSCCMANRLMGHGSQALLASKKWEYYKSLPPLCKANRIDCWNFAIKAILLQ